MNNYCKKNCDISEKGESTLRARGGGGGGGKLSK